MEFMAVRIVELMPECDPCGDAWEYLAENDAECVDPEEVAGPAWIAVDGSIYADRVGGGFFCWQMVR